MEFDFAFQNSTYSLFVGLGKQAASPVINRSHIENTTDDLLAKTTIVADSTRLLVIPERFLNKRYLLFLIIESIVMKFGRENSSTIYQVYLLPNIPRESNLEYLLLPVAYGNMFGN